MTGKDEEKPEFYRQPGPLFMLILAIFIHSCQAVKRTTGSDDESMDKENVD